VHKPRMTRLASASLTLTALAALWLGHAAPASADPSPGRQVHLPILNFLGQDEVCRSWIETQNVGNVDSKAVLVVWGEPGFCPPQCAGPLKVECTGLLRPGSTWNFLGAQLPTGAKSAMVFSFNNRPLSQIAGDLVPPDDLVADYMCETLFFGVVGDCDDFRRFKKAFNEGLSFAGVPMARAVGAPLAVEVLRTCPGDVTPGVSVTSKYSGISGYMLGAFDPVYGGFAYHVPLVFAAKGGLNSILYVQNGGLECSSLELWFKAQDDCLRARICDVATLAPGETFQFDASDCVGPDWQGSAWVRSSEPLGIVVDLVGRDVLMSYIAKPAELRYTFDGRTYFESGSQVAFGALLYSEYQGWDSGVQVMNLSPVSSAKVKVYFMDRGGDIITTLVDWVCPRGSQTYFLPVIADLPGYWMGSVRVESQEWWTPGGPSVAGPAVQAVATLVKYSDVGRSTMTEAIAYNLVPEYQSYQWQLGPKQPCPGPGCVGVIGVPSFLKDRQGTGVTTELAIQNVVPKPGFTDFALFIFDQNGLLDYICEKLTEKQVEYINLANWGYINPGFKGSAVISAVFWEHDVFDPRGRFQNNVLGLAAVTVERSGTLQGEDIPGDEAAGSEGFPILDGSFRPGGPKAPSCTGAGRMPGS
jgi:hypothetical protein